MLYDPVNNLPYPCDSETKPKKRGRINIKQRFLERKRLRRFFVKRADGDSIPIKLPPCPFPNGTQEHRWQKSTSSPKLCKVINFVCGLHLNSLLQSFRLKKSDIIIHKTSDIIIFS